MKIKLTKNWGSYTPGNILNPEDDLARTLIAKGYAEAVEVDRVQVVEVETAEAPDAVETAEAPAPRKRGRPRKFA